jgi:hypothetical protein
MRARQQPDNWASEHERYERDFKETSRDFNQEIGKMVNECSDLSKQLGEKVETIIKYGMGKDFKKIKGCPIRKKF